MQTRKVPFTFFNSSEGQYAAGGIPEHPAASFTVQLIGVGAVLDNGQQQGTYTDGDTCTINAAAGYKVTQLAVEGGSTIAELPYTFVVSRNMRITVTATATTSATLTQQHSIDMGLGAVSLANASLSLVRPGGCSTVSTPSHPVLIVQVVRWYAYLATAAWLRYTSMATQTG